MCAASRTQVQRCALNSHMEPNLGSFSVDVQRSSAWTCGAKDVRRSLTCGVCSALNTLATKTGPNLRALGAWKCGVQHISVASPWPRSCGRLSADVQRRNEEATPSFSAQRAANLFPGLSVFPPLGCEMCPSRALRMSPAGRSDAA